MILLVMALTSGCSNKLLFGAGAGSGIYTRVYGTAEGVLVKVRRPDARYDSNPYHGLPVGRIQLADRNRHTFAHGTERNDRDGRSVFFPMKDLISGVLATSSCLTIIDAGYFHNPQPVPIRHEKNDAYFFTFPNAYQLQQLTSEANRLERERYELKRSLDRFPADLEVASKLLKDREVFDGISCNLPPMKSLPVRPVDSCEVLEAATYAGAACGNWRPDLWPDCSIFDSYKEAEGDPKMKSLLVQGCRERGKSILGIKAFRTIVAAAFEHDRGENCTDIRDGSCQVLRKLIAAKEKDLFLNHLRTCVSRIENHCISSGNMWGQQVRILKEEPLVRKKNCQGALELTRDAERIVAHLEKRIRDIDHQISENLKTRSAISWKQEDLSEFACATQGS